MTEFIKLTATLLLGLFLPAAAGAASAEDEAAIRGTALDYIEGWYTRDPVRMERALHPQLIKRRVGVEAESGDFYLDEGSGLRLVQGTRPAPGEDRAPLGDRRREVTILDVFGNAATVKIDADGWVDFLHMVKWNGEWKILNVLWELRAPAAQVAELPPPAANHHQHLFRSGLPQAPPDAGPLDAARLIAKLDEVGIRQAVVLSTAYQFGNPNRPAVTDEREQVRAENDWTSEQVGRYPDRLVGFCGLNPLKDYALDELRRCAADPNLKSGLKLHLGNSDVQLENPEHLSRLREVFAAANEAGMAIMIHFRPSVSMQRPFGAPQAQLFLNEVVPAAPDVPIQIAHLGGAGSFDDPGTDEVLRVFAEAVARGDLRVKNLYFDVSGVAGFGNWQAKVDQIATRIRQLGISRVLYGSDGAIPGNTPREAWALFRQLPLTAAEFKVIAANQAPYLPARDR